MSCRDEWFLQAKVISDGLSRRITAFRRKCGLEPEEGAYLNSVNYQVLAGNDYRALPNRGK